MILLTTSPMFFDVERMQTEYSCPFCYKPIKWEDSHQFSPLTCPGCFEQIIDVTKIMRHTLSRAVYHLTKED